jgi:hypothetical protein
VATARQADAIEKSGFQVKTNRYDWLGQGIYFFERSARRAKDWANKRNPNAEVCVVTAEIACGVNGRNCLNLASREGVDPLEEFFKGIAITLPRERIVGFRRTPKAYQRFSCEIFDRFCERMAEIGWDIHVIRSPFGEDDYIFSDPDGAFPTAQLQKKARVQIAVRDCCAIRRYWLDDQLPAEV